jgi:hypothetical protein
MGGGEEGGAKPLIGTITLPLGAASSEGNAANTAPFAESAGQRYQSVYGAELLRTIPVGAEIVGLRYRLDESESSFEPGTVDDLEIRLSTSRAEPGALSTTFADNRGSDDLVVRSGPYEVRALDYPSGNSPNGFGPLIAFSQAFVFLGGPLLLEVSTTALMPGRNVDNVFPATAESESAYGMGADAVTADLGKFNDLIVVELTYVVP